MPRISTAQLRKESEELSKALVKALSERKMKITMAESCTAGLLSGTFCSAPGASGVFDGALVSYANRIKETLLGVSDATLASVGAVSAACAEQMARGAAKLFGADVALSVTGIAGPGGGTPEKPVGTVFICCYCRGNAEVRRFCFEGNRAAVRAASVCAALRLAAERLNVQY